MKDMTKEAAEELKQVLRQHALRYPRMGPTDAVKLIYQNEFGGGHLIRDEAACLEYLHREYASVEKDGTKLRQEPIGNGIVRVNLAALEPGEVEPLGRAFIRSAALHRGSVEIFRKKLNILEKLTEKGVFSFGAAELQEYLVSYERDGFPPVSHSEAYRASYHPAYRILRREELK